MTKYICDRCENSVLNKSELFQIYKANVQREVAIDDYFPRKRELCKDCLSDVEKVIGEQIERKN